MPIVAKYVKQLPISMTAEMYDQIVALAEAREVSYAALAREALERGLFDMMEES